MTLQEISEYMKLRERIDLDAEILDALKAAASPRSQVLTGMPHASEVRDKVGDLAIEIADMEESLNQLREDAERARRKIEAFISTVYNDRLRVIFRLRFIRCLTWSETAEILGWNYTEDGIKQLCYKYLTD